MKPARPGLGVEWYTATAVTNRLRCIPDCSGLMGINMHESSWKLAENSPRITHHNCTVKTRPLYSKCFAHVEPEKCTLDLSLLRWKLPASSINIVTGLGENPTLMTAISRVTWVTSGVIKRGKSWQRVLVLPNSERLFLCIPRCIPILTLAKSHLLMMFSPQEWKYPSAIFASVLMFPSYICFSVAQEFNVFVNYGHVFIKYSRYPKSYPWYSIISRVSCLSFAIEWVLQSHRWSSNRKSATFGDQHQQIPAVFGGHQGRDPIRVSSGALFLQLLMLDRAPFRCLAKDGDPLNNQSLGLLQYIVCNNPEKWGKDGK